MESGRGSRYNNTKLHKYGICINEGDYSSIMQDDSIHSIPIAI